MFSDFSLCFLIFAQIHPFYPTFGRKSISFCPNLPFLPHIWAKINLSIISLTKKAVKLCFAARFLFHFKENDDAFAFFFLKIWKFRFKFLLLPPTSVSRCKASIESVRCFGGYYL